MMNLDVDRISIPLSKHDKFQLKNKPQYEAGRKWQKEKHSYTGEPML